MRLFGRLCAWALVKLDSCNFLTTIENLLYVVKLPEVSIKRFNEINSFLDELDDILPRALGLSVYLISIVDFLI